MLGVRFGVCVVWTALVGGLVALVPAAAEPHVLKQEPRVFEDVRPLLPNLLAGQGREDLSFSGTVVERLDAGSYSYLHIQGAVDAWLVTPAAFDEGGTRVDALSFHEATDFYSARLQRRFGRLHFGAVMSLDGDVSPEMEEQ